MEAARIPTEAMSTEIVPHRPTLAPTNATIVEIAEQRLLLPELIESGDVDELARVAHMSDLLSLHEKAMKHAAEANAAGRLRTEAQAGIGLIDLRINPMVRKRSTPSQPLIIGGKNIARDTRMVWRLFGYGTLQGLLGNAMDSASSSPGRGGGDRQGEISATAVVSCLRQMGAGRWAAAPIQSAYQREKANGLTPTKLAKATGLDPKTVSTVMHSRGTNRLVTTMNYHTGILLARALGVEDELSPAPMQNARTDLSESARLQRTRALGKAASQARRWRDRDAAVRARGGKVSEIYSLVRKAEQMCTGARNGLDDRAAKAQLDAAVLNLLDAAAKLHQAALLAS